MRLSFFPLVTLDMHAVNKPEVMLGLAGQRFDEQGNLTDERSRQAVGELVAARVAPTRQVRQGFD